MQEDFDGFVFLPIGRLCQPLLATTTLETAALSSLHDNSVTQHLLLREKKINQKSMKETGTIWNGTERNENCFFELCTYILTSVVVVM